MKDRLLLPELMDDPAIDPVEHRRALAGLRRINWVCRTGNHLAKEMEVIAKTKQLNLVSILDVGCGSGDVAISVTRSLSSKFRCRTEGWDISQTACDAATESADRQSWFLKNDAPEGKGNTSSIRFRQANIFDPPIAQFDIVYCCLFLHHFSETQAIDVMRNMRHLAKFAVIIDDLLRSRLGIVLAKVGCYGLSRSPVVHYDGPQSVRAAFNASEVVRLAKLAGLENVRLTKHWPQRYLLTWQPAQ